MQIRSFRIPGIAVAVMLVFATAAFAQLPPPVPTPHTPDLLGIYPGMPMQAAVAQLQKQSSDVYVSIDRPQGFSLSKSSPDSADIITARVTHPPDGPPAVWMVSRLWNRMNGGGAAAMTVSGLLSALHAKYGPETMRKNGGSGSTTLYWIFDRNGKLLSHADPALMGCNPDAFATSVSGGPASFNPAQAPCYKSFFAVTVQFVASPGDPIINTYHLELVNLPYAVRAAMIAANAKKAAASRARQEQLQRAKQNVPKF